MNLTAITEPEAIVHKHFLDSLRVLAHISLDDDAAVIDVGTGAGFPGVVLKIYRPTLRLTLVDSSKKRVSFLKFLVPQLGLPEPVNVDILAVRAEECAEQAEHRGMYDWVFTRYVAAIAESAAYCLPLLKPTGKWVAYKYESETADAQSETERARLRALGGAVDTVFRNRKSQRSYVVMRRTTTRAE